jgi:hypothetical protein
MQIVIGESKTFPNLEVFEISVYPGVLLRFSFCKIPFLSDIEKSDIQPTLVQTQQTGQLPHIGLYLTFRLIYSFGINRVLPLVP